MPAKVKNKVAANVEAIAAHIRKTDADARRAGAVTVQQEWKVAGVPSLSLVRTPNGVWSYHLRFMAGSGARRKSVRQVIGRASGATAIKFAAARARALEVASTGAQRGDDAEPKQTLRQLFAQFEANDRDRAPRTMLDYREALERDVFKKLGDVPVDEITAKDIAKVLTKIESRSRNAAHKSRAALGSLYKWAAKRLLVDTNPMVGMGFSHRNEPRRVELSDAQLAKLWRTIDSDTFGATPAMRAILKLGILTGQRNDEVAGAERTELHIDAAIANPHWHIPARRMKRKNRDQHVFLSDQARALFAAALAMAGDSAFVFPATTHGRHVAGVEREHITQESVSKAWARLRGLAGVSGVNFHDMRKVIASWLGDRGERSDVLDRVLHHAVGHHSSQRSSVTESHYNFAIMAGPLREAWQRWGDHVWAITGQGAKSDNVRPLQRAPA